MVTVQQRDSAGRAQIGIYVRAPASQTQGMQRACRTVRYLLKRCHSLVNGMVEEGLLVRTGKQEDPSAQAADQTLLKGKDRNSPGKRSANTE